MNGDQLEKLTTEIAREDNWQITNHAYYTDPNTQKPREKDNIATAQQFSEEDPRAYTVRLFIECKTLPKATKINLKDIGMGEIQNTLFTHRIPYAKISEIEEHRKTHFYQYKDVFNPKDTSDFIYTAINQNLQSFAAFRKTNPESALYYLIVVYDGTLYTIDKNAIATTCNNALIQVESIDNTFMLPNRKCFIELVSISQLSGLLKRIKEDIQEINKSSCFYYRMEKKALAEKRRQVKAYMNRHI